MVGYSMPQEVKDRRNPSDVVFSADLVALRQGFQRDNQWGWRMWLIFLCAIICVGLVTFAEVHMAFALYFSESLTSVCFHDGLVLFIWSFLFVFVWQVLYELCFHQRLSI
jgi:hypothetical protein